MEKCLLRYKRKFNASSLQTRTRNSGFKPPDEKSWLCVRSFLLLICLHLQSDVANVVTVNRCR